MRTSSTRNGGGDETHVAHILTFPLLSSSVMMCLQCMSRGTVRLHTAGSSGAEVQAVQRTMSVKFHIFFSEVIGYM